MRAGLALGMLLTMPGVAWAETHTVMIRNGAGEAVVGVYMSAPGSGSVGANRLMSRLPPGAEGPFTYSVGCRADVRLAFAGGRSEDHLDVDVCGGVRVVAGQSGTVGPVMAGAAPAGRGPEVKGKKGVSVATPVMEPRPAVPPWTGKSITKKFGGME